MKPTEINLEYLFSPIQSLNIAKLYDSYATFIDLLIYLFLFHGVARVALEKRFPGKSGQFMINGIGVVLALALTIAESQLGFNLKSFGPVAGALLLIVVGMTLFGFLHRIGASHGLASSLTVLVIYFSLGALAPDMLFAVLQRIPWLSIVPVIAFVYSLWHTGHLLFKGSASKAMDAVENLKETASVKKMQKKLSDRSNDKQALQATKSVLNELSSKECKQSSEIIQDLEQVEDVLKHYGDHPQVRLFVAKKMQSILPKTHVLKLEMSRLKELDKNLIKGDYSMYRKLQSLYNGLNGDEKTSLQNRIRDETKRIRSEWQSERSEEQIKSHLDTLEYYLKRCAQSLNLGRVKDAIRWVHKSLDHERATESLLKSMRTAKSKLMEMITRDYKEDIILPRPVNG